MGYLLSTFALLVVALWALGSLRYAWHGAPGRMMVLLSTAILCALGGWQWLRAGVSALRPGQMLWAFLLAEFLPEHLLGNSYAVKPHLLPTCFALAWLIVGIWTERSDGARRLAFSIARRAEGRARVLLSSFVLLYCLVGSLLAIWKLYCFGYVGQDVAYFMQCLYTGSHHHLFWSNQYQDLLYTTTVQSDFAGHNQPVLFALLPLYRLFPHAETLLLSRNLLLAFAAYPVFRMCRLALQPLPSMLLTLAYLVAPAILFQNFYDYAPLSLVALPLLFALLFYMERRYWPFLGALLLCLLVREDLVFVVFGLGALALWQKRRLRWAAVPMPAALAWAVVTWRWLLPHFQHGAVSAVQGCFAYLGQTPLAMLRTAALHPSLVLTHNVFAYLKLIFTPFGMLLPLSSPVSLIASPYLLINILGDRGCDAAIVFRHYALIPAILLLPGVIRAAAWLASDKRRAPVPPLAVATFVLLSSVATTVLAVGATELAWWHPAGWQKEARQVAAMLPPAAPVAVPRYMLPLVANRDGVYQSLRLLEYHHPDAEFVVIDRDAARSGLSVHTAESYAAVQAELQHAEQFRPIYSSANYLIYRRIGPPPQPLATKLSQEEQSAHE